MFGVGKIFFKIEINTFIQQGCKKLNSDIKDLYKVTKYLYFK